MCVCVHICAPCMYLVHTEAREGIRSSETEIRDGPKSLRIKSGSSGEKKKPSSLKEPSNPAQALSNEELPRSWYSVLLALL